jgi:hypothetical protein
MLFVSFVTRMDKTSQVVELAGTAPNVQPTAMPTNYER